MHHQPPASPRSQLPGAPDRTSDEVIVVGGGLAGLAAAALLAEGGAHVRVLEQHTVPGGRARTHTHEGFHFNLGPHAFYRGGPGEVVLNSLRIPLDGAKPNLRAALAQHAGRLELLPADPWSLLRSGLLSFAARLELAAFMTKLPRLKPDAWHGHSVNGWLELQLKHEACRSLLRALVRLSCYAHAADTCSASAAIRQLQRSLDPGVLYLHGGWMPLVEQLRAAALARGVRIETGAAVARVLHSDRIEGIQLERGPILRAPTVLLAIPPEAVCRLTPNLAGSPFHARLSSLLPLRAACLDVALPELPIPGRHFVLGVDLPYYFAVHSASARVAPAGQALIHVARYLEPGIDSNDRAIRQELEGWLETLQPGWRSHSSFSRFMPQLVVSHGLAAVGQPRPAIDAAGIAGLHLAGDWVDSEYLLADASFASARAAARQTLEFLSGAARAA